MFHYLFTCHLVFLNNHTLTHFNNDYHYLRLINHLCYAWSIIFWCAWPVNIFLALDQSFFLRVISVNPGMRVINHMLTRLNNHVPYLRVINHFYYAWSVLCRRHTWSVVFIYSCWSVMTHDRSRTYTPDQPWRLISVNYIRLPLISQCRLRLIRHDSWSA